MNIKIRGIPIDLLYRSYLSPGINVLIESRSDKQEGRLLKLLSRNYEEVTIEVLMLCLGSAAFILFVHWLIKGPVLVAMVFLSAPAIFLVGALRRYCYRRRELGSLVEALRNLDHLLYSHGFVTRLSYLSSVCTKESILEAVKDRVTTRVHFIRRKELHNRSLENDDLERFRTDLRNFTKLLNKEFGLDIGPFEPYFEEAEKRIAEEEAEKVESAPV